MRPDRTVTPIAAMPGSGTVVDARMALAMWLRAGRSQRNMTLEDVARITKIQPRILERLEAGQLKAGDGMPADVFVRGFVRSIAKCVGLDETEALRRYTEAAAQAALAPQTATAGPSARALVEAMSELAPSSARTSAPRLLDSAPTLAAGSLSDLPRASEVVAPIVVVEEMPIVVEAEAVVDAGVVEIAVEANGSEPTTTSSKKKSRKGAGKGRKRKAVGTPAEPTPVVAQPIETATAIDASELAPVETAITPAIEVVAESVPVVEAIEVVEPGEVWSPKMPVVVAPTVPWRMAASAQSLARTKASTARIVPSLVIDDSDPDLAEREREDRFASREPMRRSFLPPILLDREEKSARQGGLTLAIVILLIAATLTLSYLMRRPSSSGDGVTQADLVESVDQLA